MTNIEVTPEAIAEAYKTLGISLSKAIEPTLEKGKEYKSEDDGDNDEDDNGGEETAKDKKDDKKKKKPEMEKSEPDAFAAAIEGLSKGLDSKFAAFGLIVKGLTDELSSTKEELTKAQEQLEAIESAPAGRKSITSTGFIEKAFQENESNGKKMLSVSQHKSAIQNMLIEKAGLDGDIIEKSNVNDFWVNEMQYFEATNALHPKAIEKLFTEDNIQLVK